MRLVHLNDRRSRRVRDVQSNAIPEASDRQGRFVLQKYAAQALHYGLRLEIGGVLKGWVIPKGPSMRPLETRSAIQIDDHPIACCDYEGIVPQDEYSGGAVMVWDFGNWQTPDNPLHAYRLGRLQFALEGRKLRGRWVLRLDTDSPPIRRTWRLTKQWDRAAAAHFGDIVSEQPESALTGRLIEDIVAEGEELRMQNAEQALT